MQTVALRCKGLEYIENHPPVLYRRVDKGLARRDIFKELTELFAHNSKLNFTIK
jgi:hypothetical protein